MPSEHVPTACNSGMAQAPWVSVEARPEALRMPPERTALIIVDLQNGYASPGGYRELNGRDISPAKLVSDATQQSGPAFVQDAVLYSVEAFLGWAATTDAVCAALGAAAFRDPAGSATGRAG